MPVLQRENMRLKGYDYATEGACCVTIVTRNRESLFGEIHNGKMVLNEYGGIVESTWNDLVNHNPDIGLDDFVVMPNHVHGIIVIFEPVGAGSRVLCAPERSLRREKPAPVNRAGYQPAPTRNDNPAVDNRAQARKVPLSEIVGRFKTFSARRINILQGKPGVPIWKRNYYFLPLSSLGDSKTAHIIRSDRENEDVPAYIANNPAN